MKRLVLYSLYLAAFLAVLVLFGNNSTYEQQRCTGYGLSVTCTYAR